jgi:hypothetical protein
MYDYVIEQYERALIRALWATTARLYLMIGAWVALAIAL